MKEKNFQKYPKWIIDKEHREYILRAMEREKIRVTLYKLYRGTEISYALSPCRAKVFDKCMATVPDGCDLIYSDCDGLCVTLPDYSRTKKLHIDSGGVYVSDNSGHKYYFKIEIK